VRWRAPGIAPGFTLMEVVLVLFILALAASVVVPAAGRGADAVRARAEVSAFAAFLRHAREQAVTRGEAHEVRLDPDARRLVLTAGEPETVRASRQLSREIRIEPASPAALTLRFLPQGHSTGGSFRIEAAGSRVYTVTVEAFTGRVVNARGGS
jgi:general secretion pathway protein H